MHPSVELDQGGGTNPADQSSLRLDHRLSVSRILPRFAHRERYGVDGLHQTAAIRKALGPSRFYEGPTARYKECEAQGSLGADFGLLGIKLWEEVDKHDARNKNRRGELVSLNKWRNAIAHQSFDEVSPGAEPNLTLQQVRRWRSVCRRLARSFDEVMRRCTWNP